MTTKQKPANNMTYKVSIYRDGSVTTLEYDKVKHCFWTCNNTILTLARYDDAGEHYYIHFPRERFCWYKIERELSRNQQSTK